MTVNLSNLSETSGILPVVRGGTGTDTPGTTDGALVWNGTTFTAAKIVNANVDASAAIAASKVAPPGAAGDVVVNAAGALAGVTPGTSGNVLTSNGTAWTSAAAAGGSPGGTDGDIQTKSGSSFAGLTPGSGVAAWLATPSSSNLAAAVTGETGTGALVFGTGPTLSAPVFATIVNTGTLTLPTATTTLAGIDTSDTFTNKTIVAASNTITDTSAASQDILVHNGTRFVRKAKGSDGTVVQFAGGNLVYQSVDLSTSSVSGSLPLTRGGLGADVSAFSGLVKISGGSATAVSLGANVETLLGTFSSANLRSALTDETGSGGAAVFATSPTIDAPTLSGVPVLSGASATTTNNAKGTETNVNPVNVQTTDATVTTLDSFTLASNSCVTVSWLVTAIRSTLATGASFMVTACFRNNAGTVTQVGTTITTIVGRDVATWDATSDNSTTTIRLRVTGAGSTTIQWTSVLTRLDVIP